MRLLLLRHAKSDSSGKPPDDERPLSPRGRNAAVQIGAYMGSKDYRPALVLCSTSERTKQTLELVLPSFSKRPKIRYERALYLAEWPRLLDEIRGVSEPASPLMLVGHNPGLEQLAIALALNIESPTERARLQNLAAKFPAGALAVLDFEIENWRDVKPGSGRLSDYVRPKDLRDPGDADDDA
jgi:phosphohistidine phosphatase